ncbi:MAG: tetratricopeptide repeat protein [Deltaproteobacteria bacterium]|nr:tetratricopeptide repeat protein [Deltaproteobacteria bacterium]
MAPLIVVGCADAGKDVRPDRAAAGLEMMNAGDTERAFNYLSDVVEEEYANPAAHRAYIQAAVKTRRLAEVEDEYRARTGKDPRWVARYALGIIQYVKGPVHGAAALRELRAAAELAPGLPDVHYRLGIALLEMEEMGEACEALKRCSGLDPRHPSYRPPLALCLFHNGDPAGARRELAAMLDLDPSEKDVAQASTVMARINNPFAMIPKGIESDYTKAVEYLEKHDVPARAVEILDAIAGKFPEVAPVRIMLGMAYGRLGDNARAIAELKAAGELVPDTAAVWQGLAGIYHGIDKSDLAVEHYVRAIALDPLLASAYVQLGALYVDRGGFDRAVPLFEKLVKIDRNREDYRFMLGRALQLLGRLDAAEREFLWMVEKNKESVHGLVGLGFVYAARRLREKDPDRRAELREKAYDAASQALQVDPNFEAAKKLLDTLRID